MELEELLKKIPNYTNDALIIAQVKDANSVPEIVYINQAFTKLTGYSAEEAIGKTPKMLQGPKTDREALDRIRKAIKLKKPIVEEVINYSKQKHEYWVELSISPMLNDDGTCQYFIAIEKDITEDRKSVV